MYKVCLPDTLGAKKEIAIFNKKGEALNYCYHRWSAPANYDLCNDNGTIELVTKYMDSWYVVIPLENGHIQIDRCFSDKKEAIEHAKVYGTDNKGSVQLIFDISPYSTPTTPSSELDIPKPEIVVPCQCGQCDDDYYECKGCLRTCPNCYGAADEYIDYCDACWLELSHDLTTVLIR